MWLTIKERLQESWRELKFSPLNCYKFSTKLTMVRVGLPDIPFDKYFTSPPALSITPAMSRCIHEGQFVKFDKNPAAVQAPPPKKKCFSVEQIKIKLKFRRLIKSSKITLWKTNPTIIVPVSPLNNFRLIIITWCQWNIVKIC